MKRRNNNEGNIRQRSLHSWEASIRVDDARHYVYGRSKKDVLSQLADLQNGIYQDTLLKKDDTTVAEWMNTWMDCYTAQAKQSTKARYQQDIRNHIIPELGSIPLQKLSDMTIQRFLNRCQQVKGLSEKSLKNIYLVLNKALNKALTKGLIKSNPCSEAEIPAYEEGQKKKMRPLIDKEVATFLRLIKGHEFEELYYTVLFTGMRESEAIGLTWDCINWETSEITLYRQLKMVRGKSNVYSFTTLKNNQDRTFTVPPSVMQALKRVKIRQAEQKLRLGASYVNPDGFVFADPCGRHLATRTVYRQFKLIVARMGLPQLRFHDLRHTYATLAIQNGVDCKTISHNLGHATVAFTMDVYASVSMTMQKDSVQKMEAFIASL